MIIFYNRYIIQKNIFYIYVLVLGVPTIVYLKRGGSMETKNLNYFF